MRKLLYFLASLLGDYHAVVKGKLPQRLARKAIYRTGNRIMRKLTKF